MNLGRLVKEHRTAKNMTQLDLSRELGYTSTQFVSLFERGLSKIPYSVIGKLVVILNLPENEIILSMVSTFGDDLERELLFGKRSLAKSKTKIRRKLKRV